MISLVSVQRRLARGLNSVFVLDRRAGPEDFTDARHLVAVVPADRHIRWVDPSSAKGAYYYVTAVDRPGRQSPPSIGRRVQW
jgi:hypothetical protein